MKIWPIFRKNARLVLYRGHSAVLHALYVRVSRAALLSSYAVDFSDRVVQEKGIDSG